MSEQDQPPVVEAELVEEETETAIVPVEQFEALEAFDRSQQDVMIATAHRWPRPEPAVIRERIKSYAMDKDIAPEMFYTLKRKDKRTQQEKLIQGPSVRLAQIALTCYRNIGAWSRVVANNGREVVSQGFCFDAENNIVIGVFESRSILTRTGRTFSQDMQIMAGRAANAIARRNAVFEVIPRVLTQPAYEAARKVAVGDVRSIQTTRQNVFAEYARIGVTQTQILRMLGKESMESVDLENLELLIGLGTSIKDGIISIEDAFTSAETEEEQAGKRRTLRDMAREHREKKAGKKL